MSIDVFNFHETINCRQQDCHKIYFFLFFFIVLLRILTLKINLEVLDTTDGQPLLEVGIASNVVNDGLQLGVLGQLFGGTFLEKG